MKCRVQRVGSEGAGIVFIHFHQAADQRCATAVGGRISICLEFVAAGQCGHHRGEEYGKYRDYQQEQDESQGRGLPGHPQAGEEPGLVHEPPQQR